MAKYTSAMFQGTPVIVMGIQKLPIDTKKSFKMPVLILLGCNMNDVKVVHFILVNTI